MAPFYLAGFERARRPVNDAPCGYDLLMFRIDGINGESIVIDGVWVEKLRANNSIGRNPADKYAGTEVKEFSRRKKLFGGDREELLQLTISVGTFYSLMVPADKRAEVDALLTELEAARERATS
ncbi:hypothetical protein C6A86_020645 [Mycobacterium sp. ITM-2016-00316]|uniref:hypothetical protein n=1 Tax=Mycobacterium sp. ITM-2016-00316 TaxID=2099695 RepID=UPI001E36D430|nr:hypothetical protein [Mycobacterium sp. ITM-2016-00316]WNG80605.1 hypothetical protein C6A86_020645 [Mycobacterium sp. ITM-2016-00316]